MSKKKMEITKKTSIEDLITMLPNSVTYMMDKGIKCLACGEPVWGTLESESKRKGFTEADIGKFVRELNALSKT